MNGQRFVKRVDPQTLALTCADEGMVEIEDLVDGKLYISHRSDTYFALDPQRALWLADYLVRWANKRVTE